MTTANASAASLAVASPPRRPQLAVYRRRRAAAAILLTGARSALGLSAHGVLTGPGGVPASAAGAGAAPAAPAVRAEPGDSLWSIAVTHHGTADLQRYLDALVERNGGRTRIDAGQLVRLP